MQDFNSRGLRLFPVFFVCSFSMTTIIPWPSALITVIGKLTQLLWSHKPFGPQQQWHVMWLWRKQDLVSLLPFSDFYSIGYLLSAGRQDGSALPFTVRLFISTHPPSLIQPWLSLHVFYFYQIWLPQFTSFWICLSLPHKVVRAYLPFSQLRIDKMDFLCAKLLLILLYLVKISFFYIQNITKLLENCHYHCELLVLIPHKPQQQRPNHKWGKYVFYVLIAKMFKSYYPSRANVFIRCPDQKIWFSCTCFHFSYINTPP